MSVNTSAAQGQNAYLSEPKTNGPSHGAVNGNHLETGTLGAQSHTGGMPISRNNVSVTLSPEQFEQLYLQPGGVGGKGDLSKRLGNPTPLGIAGFLLCLTPFSVYAMGFGATNTTSAIAQIGPYWSLGGICMIIAGIMEWIIGNTFPFVVFTTFGGFWLSFGFLQNPAQGIVQAYGSAANPAFNASIGVYLVCWGVLNFIYLLGSLRTNVAFVCLFFVLDMAFFLLAAAYFRIADGRADYNSLLVAGGAFGFLTTLCGWYIMLCLVLGSTGMPFNVPLGDLSGFLSGKKA